MLKFTVSLKVDGFGFQEGVEPGYVLLTVSISDADVDPNAGPFRLKIVGDGSESFSFDWHQNLITNSRLSFARKRLYLLNVSFLLRLVSFVGLECGTGSRRSLLPVFTLV